MVRRLTFPPTSEEYAEWRRPKLIATMWYCGEEYDGGCYQPRIERVRPNTIAGYPLVRREEVWHGKFRNQPEDGEMSDLVDELVAAAEEHEIPFDIDVLYGQK